ncbi:MAG: hypothetical protein SCALA702_20860 [Melioribacteraceae bacterium]|nr:MAG: hypothetical protein SCALA702_20860 [Melioribacteraceae bacterium]
MKPKPTDSELEILNILWENGSATVRKINEQLSVEKPTGYTTTLKLMQIMYEKGLLTREEKGRSHVYFPVVKKDETQKVFLDKLLNSVFNGSVSQMAMQLLGGHKTSKEEIEKIKKLLDKMEDQDGSDK